MKMDDQIEKSVLHLVRIQRIELGSRKSRHIPLPSFLLPPFRFHFVLLIVLLNEPLSVLELPGRVIRILNFNYSEVARSTIEGSLDT